MVGLAILDCGSASCFYLKFAAQNGRFVLCVNWFPSLTVYEFVCVCVNRMNYFKCALTEMNFRFGRVALIE